MAFSVDIRNPWLLAVPLALAVLKIAHVIIRTSRLRKVMPPGPAGVPLLGNVLQLGDSQWLKFTEWKEKYGPIFSMNFGPQPVIVLNDFKTAADLLDRRSQIYSSRPRFIMASEILTGSMFFPFLPYNDAWRRLRKTIHEGYSARASATYQPLQEKESAQLALHLLEKPEEWEEHVKRSAAATILCSTYGWLPVGTSADGIVQGVNTFMLRLGHACLPGSYLVESFPSMLGFPSWVAKWKRDGLNWFKQDTDMFQRLFDDVKEKVKSGTNEPSFAATVIQDMKSNLTPIERTWLAGTMLGVGSEAIAAALLVFFLAMVLHPEAMLKAQAQIDAVVGRDRLPTFSDREKLPYIEAMVREIMRWRTVGPIGLPRETVQDDWYNGHFIPKGTLILLNVWAMHRDEKYFPDPDEFRPERYLDEAGELCDPIPDTHGQGHLTYGSGRRICSGKDVSNQTLFMDFATILWAFNIKKAKDAEGREITPSNMAFVDQGIVVHPEHFKCEIVPRTPEVSSTIRTEM